MATKIGTSAHTRTGGKRRSHLLKALFRHSFFYQKNSAEKVHGKEKTKGGAALPRVVKAAPPFSQPPGKKELSAAFPGKKKSVRHHIIVSMDTFDACVRFNPSCSKSCLCYLIYNYKHCKCVPSSNALAGSCFSTLMETLGPTCVVLNHGMVRESFSETAYTITSRNMPRPDIESIWREPKYVKLLSQFDRVTGFTKTSDGRRLAELRSEVERERRSYHGLQIFKPCKAVDLYGYFCGYFCAVICGREEAPDDCKDVVPCLYHDEWFDDFFEEVLSSKSRERAMHRMFIRLMIDPATFYMWMAKSPLIVACKSYWHQISSIFKGFVTAALYDFCAKGGHPTMTGPLTFGRPCHRCKGFTPEYDKCGHPGVCKCGVNKSSQRIVKVTLLTEAVFNSDRDLFGRMEMSCVGSELASLIPGEDESWMSTMSGYSDRTYANTKWSRLDWLEFRWCMVLDYVSQSHARYLPSREFIKTAMKSTTELVQTIINVPYRPSEQQPVFACTGGDSEHTRYSVFGVPDTRRPTFRSFGTIQFRSSDYPTRMCLREPASYLAVACLLSNGLRKQGSDFFREKWKAIRKHSASCNECAGCLEFSHLVPAKCGCELYCAKCQEKYGATYPCRSNPCPNSASGKNRKHKKSNASKPPQTSVTETYGGELYAVELRRNFLMLNNISALGIQPENVYSCRCAQNPENATTTTTTTTATCECGHVRTVTDA